MIIDIVYYLSLILMAIFGLILYVFLVSTVLPKVFLRPGASNAVPKDRGIKKFTFYKGRAIVYEPSLKSKKYFEQYILSENNGDKFLKCKADSRVINTRYTVIAIGPNDNVIDVIDVEEILSNSEYTKAVILPRNTSYINLIVREVNGITVTERDKVVFSGASMLIYSVCSVILSVVISMIINSALTTLFSNLLAIPISSNVLFSVIVGILIGALYALIVCAFHISGESSVKLSSATKKNSPGSNGRNK